jgi:hypothetical protein
MRTSFKTFLLVPAFVLAGACNKDKPADPALNTDLGLAAQPRPGAMDSISAAERMNGAATPAGAPAPGLRAGAAPAATTRPTASSTTHRSTTTHHASSGTRSAGSSGNTTVAAEPRTEIHKNTKRDAAIGAATGAVLGGVVGHGGVKGGIIGAAAGGILGGVIGNNVDVQKKKVP